jgi:hypothetical protein
MIVSDVAFQILIYQGTKMGLSHLCHLLNYASTSAELAGSVPRRLRRGESISLSSTPNQYFQYGSSQTKRQRVFPVWWYLDRTRKCFSCSV